MRATGSPTASSACARRDARTSALHRLLLVLGLAVGGWLVSALVAGAATADETSGPAPDLPGCSHEAAATREDRAQEVGSDLDDCEAQSAPQDTDEGPDEGTDEGTDSTGPTDSTPPTDGTDPTGPADGTGPTDGPDSTDGTDSDQPAVRPGTEFPSPDDNTEDTEDTDNTEDADGTDGTGLPDDSADRSSDTGSGDHPDEVDIALPGAPSPEAGRKPTLLGAATGTLLSTTGDLAHTAGSLTDLLFGALPEVTDPIRDTIEDVVDVPSTLPSGESPVDVLPGFPLPRLPIDIGHLIPVGPGEQPGRPDGEARIEPVTSPRKAPEPPPATPRNAAEKSDDGVTETAGTSHWTVPEAEDGTEAKDGSSSRPLGPAAPSPAAPASVTAPSNVAASPQDGSQHLHRGEHGILDDLPTVTQLRLLGSSRDHDIVGGSREAALPTTSPD